MADGFGVHFDHVFIYVAMAFSCTVEALNMVRDAVQPTSSTSTIRMVNLDLKRTSGVPKTRSRCADAVSTPAPRRQFIEGFLMPLGRLS